MIILGHQKAFSMTNIYVFHLNFSDLSLDSLKLSCTTFVGGRTRVSLRRLRSELLNPKFGSQESALL